MNETKTVALVASLWMGHHPMYFKVFVSALAELGIRVLPFCPVPDDLTELLANLRADSSRNGRLQIEPPQAITFPPPSRIRPGDCVQSSRRSGILADSANGCGHGKRRTGAKLISFCFCMYLRCPVSVDSLCGTIFSLSLVRALSSCPFVSDAGVAHSLCGTAAVPGKILYAQIGEFRGGAGRGSGTAVAKTCGRPVVAFPDFTDIHLPPKGDSAWGLANKIRECARGRPVVSLVGHLQRTKGMEER